MMQDKSGPEYKETWEFLDRRFEEDPLSGVVKGGPEDLGKLINGLGTTFKTIIGLPR